MIKMKLSEYENKCVVVETTDREIFKGIVGDYVDSFDSPNGKEMIILDIPRVDNPIGIFCDEIMRISVVNKERTA